MARLWQRRGPQYQAGSEPAHTTGNFFKQSVFFTCSMDKHMWVICVVEGRWGLLIENEPNRKIAG